MAKTLDTAPRRLSPRERDRRLESGARLEEFRAAAAEITALNQTAVEARDLALASLHRAMETRLIVGMKLIEFSERFAGEFDDWLEGYCGELFSRPTAYRWMARVRHLQAVLGNDNPTLEELKRAQIAAETLPEPPPGGQSQSDPPPFRLKLELPTTVPPEEWEPGIRQEFLIQAKPITELYDRIRALDA